MERCEVSKIDKIRLIVKTIKVKCVSLKYQNMSLNNLLLLGNQLSNWEAEQGVKAV